MIIDMLFFIFKLMVIVEERSFNMDFHSKMIRKIVYNEKKKEQALDVRVKNGRILIQ